MVESVARRMDCLDGEEDREGGLACFGRDMSRSAGYMMVMRMEVGDGRWRADQLLIDRVR